MSLFFMEFSDFHIKNSLKTFQNIVYALIYEQQTLIIWSLARIGAPITRQLVRELSRGGLIRRKLVASGGERRKELSVTVVRENRTTS